MVVLGEPTGKSFAEIVALAQDHHQPCPSTIVQHLNFHTRTQKPGELISEFVARLQKSSEFCGFKETLEDMLRDHLVCGCKDKRLQCKLLVEKRLTFKQALAIAKATEAAEREVRKRSPTNSPAPVNAIHGEKLSIPKTTTNRKIIQYGMLQMWGQAQWNRLQASRTTVPHLQEERPHTM